MFGRDGERGEGGNTAVGVTTNILCTKTNPTPMMTIAGSITGGSLYRFGGNLDEILLFIELSP